MLLLITPIKPVESKPFIFGNTYFAFHSGKNSFSAEVLDSDNLLDTYFRSVEGVSIKITSNKENKKAINSVLRGQGRFEYRITGNLLDLFKMIYKNHGQFEFVLENDFSSVASINSPEKIFINDMAMNDLIITDKKYLALSI
jgi:hypothetical protein